MDYKAFFAEVADWINQANQTAIKCGIDSDVFWEWVVNSTREICDKYQNNKLVIKQMSMLFEWLDDVYAERGK
jgi:KaiC/GvpD/RAD55 family RecA-like ATPase